MLLKLDENNYIEGYVIIGGLEGAIEVDLDETEIPFPHYEAYQYIDVKIVLDENKLNEIEWLLKNLQPNPYETKPSFPNKDYPWWKLPVTIC